MVQPHLWVQFSFLKSPTSTMIPWRRGVSPSDLGLLFTLFQKEIIKFIFAFLRARGMALIGLLPSRVSRPFPGHFRFISLAIVC